jgi:hypothetical protein
VQPPADHYFEVASTFAEGGVVPLLGAGVNLCGRPAAEFTWDSEQRTHLPSGAELSKFLAGKYRYRQEKRLSDLLRVSQFVATMRGDGDLYKTLHELFDADYEVGPLHTLLAQLPGLLRREGKPTPYQVILTTNYDDALERAFIAEKEPFDLISYIAASPKEHRGKFMHFPPDGAPRVIEVPNEYDKVDPDRRTVIVKVHGAVKRHGEFNEDNYVITEDDYIEYLTRTDVKTLMPVLVTSRLSESHFLFLGYSMSDWNLRVILRRIWGEQPLSFTSWTIQRESDDVERKAWMLRNVESYEIDLAEYVRLLRDAFVELKSTETAATA